MNYFNRAGDFVWAGDEKTGDAALKQVVETYVNETEELIYLSVNGEEITCTPGHPFYSPVKSWTEAVQLRAGDILVGSVKSYAQFGGELCLDKYPFFIQSMTQSGLFRKSIKIMD